MNEDLKSIGKFIVNWQVSPERIKEFMTTKDDKEYWLEKAKQAELNGFIGEDESLKLINSFLQSIMVDDYLTLSDKELEKQERSILDRTD